MCPPVILHPRIFHLFQPLVPDFHEAAFAARGLDLTDRNVALVEVEEPCVRVVHDSVHGRTLCLRNRRAAV